MTTTETTSNHAIPVTGVNAAEIWKGDPDPENLRTLYKELCTSYRAIDDFRAKLLAALPLASGTGIFLLSGDPGKLDTSMLLPIGLFGFVVTLGLMIFEIHGIRRCTHLIALGRYLEAQLEIEGQFRNRCTGLQPLGDSQSKLARYVNEPLAAGIIYPAVLASWFFLALRWTFSLEVTVPVSLVFFLMVFFLMCKFNIWLVDKDIEKKLNELENRSDLR